jgi:hypothetical protein
MKKLKDLELRKLILELELLEMDEKYNLEFVDNYRPLFNEHLRKVSPDFKEPTPTPPPTEGEEPTPPQETPVFQVDEEELKKIKKIYKEISKICHPDKTSDTFSSFFLCRPLSGSSISTMVGSRIDILTAILSHLFSALLKELTVSPSEFFKTGADPVSQLNGFPINGLISASEGIISSTNS